MIGEPKWLQIARQYIGTREIPGPQHNLVIVNMWEEIGAPFRDDETAWCGAFVGHVLQQAGFSIVAKPALARDWQHLPVQLIEPARGSIAEVTMAGIPAELERPCGLRRG